MNNKEIISKIKDLQNIKADQQWKTDNRNFLYAKISETENALPETNLFVNIATGIKNFFAQPSFAIVLVVALVVASSLFGARAMNFMPGDSLYIAQIMSEEAQLALTFDQEKKNKLGIKFASDRAKQITEVLAQAKLGEPNEKEVELKQDFQKEIDIVKNKLAEMQNEEEDEDAMVFSANLSKEDQGVEIASPNSSESNNQTTKEGEEADNAHDMLAEAEELFNQKDYDGAKQKIEEVDALINKEEEVKTEEITETEEEATTTEEAPAVTETESATSTNATSTELN